MPGVSPISPNACYLSVQPMLGSRSPVGAAGQRRSRYPSPWGRKASNARMVPTSPAVGRRSASPPNLPAARHRPSPGTAKPVDRKPMKQPENGSGRPCTARRLPCKLAALSKPEPKPGACCYCLCTDRSAVDCTEEAASGPVAAGARHHSFGAATGRAYRVRPALSPFGVLLRPKLSGVDDPSPGGSRGGIDDVVWETVTVATNRVLLAALLAGSDRPPADDLPAGPAGPAPCANRIEGLLALNDLG